MRDSMLGSASTSWGIPQRSIALVLSLSSYTGHPRIPPGGDTVATSGFPLLPHCFTHDRWTAEFGVCGLVTVRSLLAKRWCPRIGSSSLKGLKFLRFSIGKVAMIWVNNANRIDASVQYRKRNSVVNRNGRVILHLIESSLMCTKRCLCPLARVSA